MRNLIICTFHQIKEDGMETSCSIYMGKIRNEYSMLVGREEVSGRSKHRLGINTEMNLKGTGYKDEIWDLSDLG
jgi:hypothetical protein